MSLIKTVISICLVGTILREISAETNPLLIDVPNEGQQYLNVSLRKVGENFEKAAQCLKERMETGVPSLNIPPLEPIKFPNTLLIIKNDLIKSNLMLSDIKLEGLGQFNLTDGALEGGVMPDRLHMRVHFDTVRLNTRYRGSIALFDKLKLSGKGTASISLKGFDLDMSVMFKLNLIKLRVQITGLKLAIKLPSVEANITGLSEEECFDVIISNQLSKLLTSLVEEQTENINALAYNTLWPILSKDINEILKDVNVVKIPETFREHVKILCGEEYLQKLVQQCQTNIVNYLKDKFQETLEQKNIYITTV